MKSIFFNTPNGRVHALYFGYGERLLIALHGFSDHAWMYAALEKTLSEQYLTVAIDLPFHGKTEWNKSEFTKEDLIGIIRQVLKKAGKTRFTLMGFSFGARLAQAMLPELGPQLDKLLLLSPDGVRTKGMLTAARTPMWVRRLLFRIVGNPGWLISGLNMGSRLKFLPLRVHQFILQNLSRPIRMRRLFGCWLSMNSFSIQRRELRRILKETGLPMEVYLGADDTLLHKKALKSFYGKLPNVRLFVLKNMGHRIVGNALGLKLRRSRGKL